MSSYKPWRLGVYWDSFTARWGDRIAVVALVLALGGLLLRVGWAVVLLRVVE